MSDTRAQVSVLVPAYHSDGTIASCLASLARQTLTGFEVIVVNSSAEERTAAVVAEFPSVRFVQSAQRLLPHAARNAAVELARGDILVFTDPDCEADPEWLERLVAPLCDGARVTVGAMGLKDRSWLGTGIHVCKYSWALPGRRAETLPVAPTANCAYARSLWDEIGPFDGRFFCGDALLSWKAARRGDPPRFVPDAVVRHEHGGTFTGFFRERLARGGEFAGARAAFEGWTRARMFAYAVAAPLLLPLVLLRTARDCAAVGWLGAFLRTLPVQLAGQAGWIAGETRAYLMLNLASRSPR